MNRQIKILKLSVLDYHLSSEQWNRFTNLITKINQLESTLITKVKVNSSIILNPLLEFESVASAQIEGTQTQYHEIFDDINGIDNVYSWEVRNLISLYKETFAKLENNQLRFNVERLVTMHEKLYSAKMACKWQNQFDPTLVQKQVRPGQIIKNDATPNWIGAQGGGIKNANLIPVKPNLKVSWLKDLYTVISQETKRKELVIFFHPIFEAIHPFADGNGRLGRLLWTSLFKYLGLTQNNWCFFSDIIETHKTLYLAELHHVQVTNDWHRWTNYFLDLLSQVITKRSHQVQKIIDLFQSETQKLKSLPNDLTQTTEGYILRAFFKYPYLNKSAVIKKLVTGQNIPKTTAYATFTKVVEAIGAQKNRKNQFVYTKLLKIIVE